MGDKYCPVSAWKKAKDKGFSPYEQVKIGKKISKIMKGCDCDKK